MTIRSRLTIVFWLLALGYLGLYVYGLVMGVFSPGEMVGFTVVAVVIAVLYAVRVIRVRRAMRDHNHDELMKGVHHSRETMGF